MFHKPRVLELKVVCGSKIVVFILLGIGWSGYTSVSQEKCFYRNIANGKKGPRVECFIKSNRLIKMKIKKLKSFFYFLANGDFPLLELKCFSQILFPLMPRQ